MERSRVKKEGKSQREKSANLSLKEPVAIGKKGAYIGGSRGNKDSPRHRKKTKIKKGRARDTRKGWLSRRVKKGEEQFTLGG